MLPSDLFWLTTGAVVGVAVGLVVARRVTGGWHRNVAIALATAHLGAVVGVTLFPLGFEGYAGLGGNVALEPLRTIRQLFDGSQSLRQLGGNLLLLAPMGLLVPIAWRAARSWRRTMFWGLVASVVIEVSQWLLGVLGLTYRVVDVDDVLLNVLGVAVGRAVFAVGWPLWRALRAEGRG